MKGTTTTAMSLPLAVVVYVLSLGPIFRYYHGQAAIPEAVRFAYRPLMWMCERFPGLADPLNSYLWLWIPD